MVYRILADAVVLIHFAFVLFVAAGALLALRRPRWALVHIPCAVYGALIEFVGWYCPLTPLENWLRWRGGGTTYETGFIEHYILPLLYPAGMTREVQLVLGSAVVIVNLLIYTLVARRVLRRSAKPSLRGKPEAKADPGDSRPHSTRQGSASGNRRSSPTLSCQSRR